MVLQSCVSTVAVKVIIFGNRGIPFMSCGKSTYWEERGNFVAKMECADMLNIFPTSIP